jgi:Arc/MetJ-type ribon-helix-helix transcriptional regulator
MGKEDDEHTERFAFKVTRYLANFVKKLKDRGYFVNNAEIGRASLPFLIDHYRKLGMIDGQVEKKKK